MQEVAPTVGVIRSARTVGGGVGSVVIAAPQQSPSVTTARQTLAACNAARYSES